ncbi:hypothetical protein BCR35DRAFT_302705 [Leucosporidium creatinivorum]|uniref:Major facilitator superfamily domain-containing protein n=1 Tax=Leucosporidium creatinivorum TaxID=106004 RepID=A0A1Y2FPY3_9BASI|nr:hypothetical protein BCR35DRAFT_302705 [Leucosporidium creatinivorum]
MAASESTPLLANKATEPPAAIARSSGLFPPFRRLLLVSLLLSVAFVSTATPLLYQMKVMSERVCEEWEACSARQASKLAAQNISLMVTLTTLSGILNLFSTGWLMRRYGPRFAMVMQTLVPCLRNVAQTCAVLDGGILGIRLLQWTQLMTIFGGGAGYMLTANTFVNALVTPEERTASFGILQGVFMFGSMVGFSIGGLVGDRFGDAAPFEVTLSLLIISTILSSAFLPYIAPEPVDEKGGTGIGSMLKPLLVLGPRRTEKEEGGDGKRYWGVPLLTFGTAMGVFASAYVPMMLQMVATNEFGFGVKKNGYMMSLTSASRGAFLTLLFPRIIALGRRLYTNPKASPPPTPSEPSGPLPTTPADFEPLSALPEAPAEEPTPPPKPTDADHGSHFDLAFLRSSLVVDALLTAGASFISEGWHIYAAALILPLASGTAPAAKGVLLELVPAAQQSEALAGIALVETIAMTLTVSVFGLVFAYLSEIGQPFLVFDLNAAVALLAAIILAFVRFPRVIKGAGDV